MLHHHHQYQHQTAATTTTIYSPVFHPVHLCTPCSLYHPYSPPSRSWIFVRVLFGIRTQHPCMRPCISFCMATPLPLNCKGCGSSSASILLLCLSPMISIITVFFVAVVYKKIPKITVFWTFHFDPPISTSFAKKWKFLWINCKTYQPIKIVTICDSNDREIV